MRIFIVWILSIGCLYSLHSQTALYHNAGSAADPIDTLQKNRLTLAIVSGSTGYMATSYALYQAWYKQYPQSSFHFHNDWGQWQNVDKFGHVYSAYFQTRLTYQMARWTGMKEGPSLLLSSLASTLFQSTIEVMDGFSEDWGFSIADWTANAIGTGSFVLQEALWQEQRFLIKVSSWPTSSHSTYSSNDYLNARSEDLFGRSLPERWLKDYNAQTIWMSFRPIPKRWQGWPSWLNVAVGYGGENMYGGYQNSWLIEGQSFNLDEITFPRYKQFYLSLDVDLNKIRVNKPWLRTILDILNIIKLPFTAIEINTLGQIKLHIIHF